MKKFIASLTVLVGLLAVTASAQPSFTYRSSPLLARNVYIAANSTTNFAAVNYPDNGVWLQVDSPAGLAQSSQLATLLVASAQTLAATNSSILPYTTNMTFTFAPILDDVSRDAKYISTNSQFTVSVPASNTTNAVSTSTTPVFVYQVQIGASNFLGCKNFKLVSVVNPCTNAVTILSARIGFPITK